MASLEEIRSERIKKLELLKEKGINPYPVASERDFTIEEALISFDTLVNKGEIKILLGRLRAVRGQGGVIFFDIDDSTGSIQGVLKKEEVEEDVFSLFVDTIDIGDFIQVSGTFFATKRGEKSILVKSWKMLSKSLRPLPDKWHGLSDIEERFRRRYLDLLSSPEVKNRFLMRSKIVSSMRHTLDDLGFVEVETPILQHFAGGATAEPFVTHHNALDIDLYLRIAPELFLKKLIIGGMNKVYEIGRLFRNEGIDATHNPEFTIIELYEAYKSADDHMTFLETLLRGIVTTVTGGTKVTFGEDEIDWGGDFKRVPFLALFKEHLGIENIWDNNEASLLKIAKDLKVDVPKDATKAKIVDAIYKKKIREKIVQPTYLVDYPLEFSPLAKRKENNKELIDRYQLVVGGLEIVNAFSELNDPIDQRNRFNEQEKNKERGDKEAQSHDEEYVEAIEYGLPPTAGLGLSIDRLVMLLTNAQNIREVILFPTLRPKK